MELHLGKDTRMCVSLSARPGNFGTRFHNHLYRELGLDFVYKAFATDDIRGALVGVRALRIRGCAISMPFKETCIEHLDDLTPSAARIGAVNTIVNDDGHLTGHNTDCSAVRTLLEEHALPPDTPFALRGSGGMARAVVCALHDAGLTRGVFVARNRETGPSLARASGLDWTPELTGEPPALLINATPIGMAGTPDAQSLPFTEDQIRAADIVFDVVATPSRTPFLQLATTLGKQTITGAEVIVLQAATQFELYTGHRPTPEAITRAATFALAG